MLLIEIGSSILPVTDAPHAVQLSCTSSIDCLSPQQSTYSTPYLASADICTALLSAATNHIYAQLKSDLAQQSAYLKEKERNPVDTAAGGRRCT